MVAQADVSGAQASASMRWGGDTNYKSLYLDTVEQPPRMKVDDSRNPLTRYDQVDGSKPAKLPHARVRESGYREARVFPHNDHPMPAKEQVEKSTPVSHYRNDPRELMSLTSKDITGAGLAHPPSLITTRCVDPLQPTYQIATVRAMPPPVPRFIRDHIDASDINAKAELSPRIFVSPSQQRHTSLYKDDIEGTTPRKRIIDRAPGQESNSLATDDVSKALKRLPWKIEETTRQTNPLEPAYRYNVPKGAGPNWSYGRVDGQKSTRFFTGAKLGDTPGAGHGAGDTAYREYISRTDDIEGAHTGTRGRFVSRVSPFYRTQVGISNYNDDVEGAKTSGAFSLLPKFVITQRFAQSQQVAPASGSQTAREMGSSRDMTYTAPLSARGSGRGGTPAMMGSPKVGSPMLALSPKVGTPKLALSAKVGSPKVAFSPQLGTPRASRAPSQGSATPRALNKQLLAAFSG